MAGGYMGKLLFVDLSTGSIREENPEESLYRDFIGGYGIGARILYSRQRAGVDPLGPDNMLGFVTGPLTGTPAVTGARYQVVSKSPLTVGWGDANSGGFFGPNLKSSGYDGVFFTGISNTPVYLFIDNGKAELKDASYLWGKDTYETEDILKTELGRKTEIVCIGPSGENLSLISGIITRKGAAAGRSGLGAVMGSKKLKAVATRGDQKVPLTDSETAHRIRKEHIEVLKTPGPRGGSFLDRFHKYGTSSAANRSALSGDSPVKNWGGVGVVDFPDPSQLDGPSAIANLSGRSGCWNCPIACEGRLKAGTGDYQYPAGTRRVEYETQASFGTMCLNNNIESINMANHICNSYGLDTISAGCTIAFAIECYENGLITKDDTDGIELTWGNHQASVAMTEKMAKREGFGDILADGVKIAAEKIRKGADVYAVHIGGQELGMHDPKLAAPRQPSAARYQMDATPGRHTQGFGPTGFRGHLVNAMGVCMFGYMMADPVKHIAEMMTAVTGWQRSIDELLQAGERITNLRHAFNLRENINPIKWTVHPRITGDPPQKEGPLAGVRVDLDEQVAANLKTLDWDPVTTKPSKNKLIFLGLDDVAKDLWP